MSVMITEVYDALRDATGVSEEKARKAAEAVASYDQGLANVDLKVEGMLGSLRVMQWMLGTLIAGVAALLVKTFG